jgi:hypothetical protein
MRARAEVEQVELKQLFFKQVCQELSALFASLWLHQVEDLRRAIYYSPHSWSDGLPLLKQCLLSPTAAYGDYLPTSPDDSVCPVSFTEDDVKRQVYEFKDIVHPEEWLDVHITAHMKAKGMLVHQDGSVN